MGNHVPWTVKLGLSLPAAGRLRILCKMEGSGEAKVPLARLGLVWPGCALGVGTDRRRWASKYYSLRRLGNNRLGGPSIPRVEEAVDCGMRRGRNGGSSCSAGRQDDALGRWWETVPPLGLLFCLAVGGDDGAERFYGVQPG